MGLYKRRSGRPSITWPEAVDGALCFGWIDGVRKSIDNISYKIRFTPRKPRSVWSAVNAKRATELSTLGLMRPAGLAAFHKFEAKRSNVYSYEQRKAPKLPASLRKGIPGEESSLAILSSTSPLVPENVHLLGDQREKRRN